MKAIEFTSKKDLFKYLRENADDIISQKKEMIKHADSIDYVNVVYAEKEMAYKSDESSQNLNKDEIKVKVVVNTTNLIDSHMDCHIEGIWNQSLKSNRKILLLKEHKATFEDVISDDVTPTAKTMEWSSLGFDFAGKTQALIFDANIKKERNPYMYEQYKNGYVNNHSVGMKYVNIYMCLNSEEKCDEHYKNNWDKYIKYVANKDVADDYGYFFAVTEAKLMEGSAVIFGSNYATPTLSVVEPSDTPKTEPSDTPKKQIEFEKFKYVKL